MPTAYVNNLGINYERHGDLGDPLVFVHGYIGAVDDWRHQIAEFAGDYQILAFDHRGHGASDAPPDESAYTLDHIIADTMALIAETGFEHYHLVGHSLGGAVAQEIALLAPSQVTSLTLCDTTDWFGDHDQQGGTPPYFPPGVAETAIRRAKRMSRAALSGTWEGLLAWQGTRDRAAHTDTPALIVYGDRDASRIIEGSMRLQQEIPKAETVIIPGAGHNLPKNVRKRTTPHCDGFCCTFRTAVFANP